MKGLRKMLGGKILKVGRKVRGLTQSEVAAIYGVSTCTYSKWETGVHAVSFDDVATICECIFKMPLDEAQRMAAYA